MIISGFIEEGSEPAVAAPRHIAAKTFYSKKFRFLVPVFAMQEQCRDIDPKPISSRRIFFVLIMLLFDDDDGPRGLLQADLSHFHHR